MFYAQLILAKKGVLGKIWLAAHWDKKLNRQLIFQTDVTQSAESIADPRKEMPLRVSGSLLLGVVRIFSHKVKYLSTDCDLALSKMKMAFRPGMDLDGTTKQGEGDEEDDQEEDEEEDQEDPRARRESKRQNGNKAMMIYGSLTLDALPPVGEEWLNAAAQSMARRQDITMEEGGIPHGQSLLEAQVHDRETEEWEAFDPAAMGVYQEHDDDEEEEAMQADDREEVLEDEDDGAVLEMGGDDFDLDDGGDEPEMARRQQESDAGGLAGGKKDSLDLSLLDESMARDDGQEEEDGGEAMLVVHDDDEGGAPPLSPSQALPDDDVSNMFSPDSPMARVSLGLNLPRTPGSEQAAEAPPSTSKKSRKRPLQADENTQINGKEFKAYLNNYSDLLAPRVKPKDRAQGREGGAALLTLEERLSRPWLAGKVSSDVEAIFSTVMQSSWPLSLPIALTKAARQSRKRARDGMEEAEDDEEAGALVKGGAVVGGNNKGHGGLDAGVEESKGQGDEEEEGQAEDDVFEGGMDDFGDMDDGGPWHDGGLGGRGREEDDEEEAGGDDEEDDDEFISQNAAQEDGAAWHPNTVKMLKVLRRRVGDSGSGRVGFQRLSQGSRRNRAANQFFEILQLKTWDFIQVDQERPYGDIKITPAARFREVIPSS